MHQCPHCNEPLEGPLPFCWRCGREIRAAELDTPLGQSASDAPREPIAPVPERVAGASSRQALLRRKLIVGGTASALAVLGIVLVMGRASTDPAGAPQGSPSPPVANAAAPAAGPAIAPAAAPAVAPEPVIETELAPTWTGARRAAWARDGSRTINFQVGALDDVQTWMNRVRPVLVVRCLRRATEVFVATGSSVNIEEGAEGHTVSIQFDNEPPIEQSWPGSVSYQELFAPDGIAMARRLARAQMLRFTFTPYNSRPVMAAFNVRGFDQLVGDVARTCGWRVEQVAASRR
jgi:hypothetical protein